MTFTQFVEKHGITMRLYPIPASEERAETFHPDSITWLVVLATGNGNQLYHGPYSEGPGIAYSWAEDGCKIPNTYPVKRDSRAMKAWAELPNKASAYRAGGRMTVNDDAALRTIRERYSKVGPAIENVLQSLQCDMMSADYSFEEWADALGYDSDSRKAERLWRKCVAIRRDFLEALGDDGLVSFMEIEEE